MTLDEDKIKDWRSTGRRKGRRTLFSEYVEYKCADCGVTSKEPPKDAPKWFDEIWPEERRELDYSLQVDHESKDIEDNTIDNLNWRCSPCHIKRDRKTEKGVSTKEEVNFW